MAQAQITRMEETVVSSTAAGHIDDDYSLMSMSPYLDWLDLRTDINPIDDDVIIEGESVTSSTSSPSSSATTASTDGSPSKTYSEGSSQNWGEDAERERHMCLRYLKAVIENKNEKIKSRIEKHQERVDSLIQEYQINLQELRDLEEI